jgi:cob(I)alamin adenosyltransferase
MSTTSDDAFVDNRRAFSGVSEASLHTLDEEEVASGSHSVRTEKKNAEEHGDDDLPPPMTPKAQAGDSMVPPPTDTVTAHRFLDMQFPATVVRPSFRDNSLSLSPGKRDTPSVSGHGFSRGKHMTLKEQSSTIDRLSKENFDLKMRIHFLNEALSKRSEEGIQEMVSENVELKSDKLKLQKDNQALRKTIRELQKQLRDRGKAEDESEDGERGSEGRRTTIEEEELTYLRERVETYEVEIERLRSESIARESEKRKLAEMVKTLGDGRANVGSDAGAREERVSDTLHRIDLVCLSTFRFLLLPSAYSRGC